MKRTATAPRVAVTMRVTQATGYDEARDSISHDWLDLLCGWGMVPLLIPNLAEPTAYLDGLGPDLLVLTGGDDPGATPRRDAAERALLGHAMDRKLPVLGVCRGLQMINDWLGGGSSPVAGHVATPHRVSFAASWRDTYGASATVNSFHRQGVAEGDLGNRLIAAALDGAGMVEALHHRDLPLAAVMWHPERDGAADGDRRLFHRLASGGTFPA